ncbi:MAG: guanylate kinase [Oscillospiraceae bacterium]|nr:MAG: guanylate kinase [Oscillospiraceae bacterium]
MRQKGLLIVISGPSGCGKGTICKELRAMHPEIKVSVSTTTREIRAGEVEGRDYRYISKEEFERQVQEGEFLEYARIYSGNYYGTPKKYVKETLMAGDDLILEIDIQGALQVKEKFEEGVFIFLVPPSMEELHRRLVQRGRETPELIMERFKSAYEEMNFINRYNYVVTNDKVDEAIKKIEAIIAAEKCRVVRNEALLHEILDGGI